MVIAIGPDAVATRRTDPAVACTAASVEGCSTGVKAAATDERVAAPMYAWQVLSQMSA
jgi:hypothetical protein